MLSSVLRSPRAIAVNVEIMRAFVRLRGVVASVEELRRALTDLERRHDGQLKVVFDVLRKLIAPAEPPRRRIGLSAQKVRSTTTEPSCTPAARRHRAAGFFVPIRRYDILQGGPRQVPKPS